MNVHVAAVDLGASSGRVVLGEVGPNALRAKTVARFGNDPVRLPDGLHWNVVELYRRVLLGLSTAQADAHSHGGELATLGVDSWAVDYGLLAGGRLLGPPYHYRDQRGEQGVSAVHAKITAVELYQRNGLQFLPFNTFYQLAADAFLSVADDLLLIPDLVTYWLTGLKATERTNASTTGLLNRVTGGWDTDLASLAGIPDRLLGTLVDAGECLGVLLPNVAEALGIGRLEVVAVASHDTASAVVATPLEDDQAAYISCGTWGLVGVELDHPVLTDEARRANFTNEVGVDGRTRFLTNVMGLWILDQTLGAWSQAGGTERLRRLLAAATDMPPTTYLFDVQDPVFVPPGDMPSRITHWYSTHGLPPPSTRVSLVRAILDSLAQAFADAVKMAEELSRRRIRTIHLVGGGALNTLLCQATADRSECRVLAGPVEATALGNILMQGTATGAVNRNLQALRHLVAENADIKAYQPQASTT